MRVKLGNRTYCLNQTWLMTVLWGRTGYNDDGGASRVKHGSKTSSLCTLLPLNGIRKKAEIIPYEYGQTSKTENKDGNNKYLYYRTVK